MHHKFSVEDLPKKQPEVYKPPKPKYFTRDEVVIHCSSKDIWIIINKSVFNLTPFIKDRMETMNDVNRNLYVCLNMFL